MLRPLLIRITPDGVDRRNFLKLIDDLLTVDVSCMEDGIHVCEYRQHLRAQKIMGVRDDTELHRLLSFAYFSV